MMVRVERLELPTLWSQTRCATKLRYTRMNYLTMVPPPGIEPGYLPYESSEIAETSLAAFNSFLTRAVSSLSLKSCTSQHLQRNLRVFFPRKSN